jgi:hypothetical protein
VIDYDEYDEGGLEPGLTYTPGHTNHLPPYDEDRYELDRILYNGRSVTNSAITCPDDDFICEYYFELLPPPDWEWRSTVRKGAEMRYTKVSDTEYTVRPLTASEWNDFIDHIVWFLDYLGMTIQSGDITSWYVTRGTEMEADDVDKVRQLIDALNPPIDVPNAISSGRRITAAFINGLKDSLNSIER